MCSGKVLWKGHNDFASQCPELLVEWNYKKNKKISPDELKLGDCDTEVWWICKVCGNEWSASIYNRVHLHSGCRKCSSKRVGEMNSKRLSKKVLCVTTDEVFDSLSEAAKHYGTSKSSVSKCCKGIVASAGKLKDGTKLVWTYYDT